jgi:divalent metal cation (Fe/Co/Zn/Cd) transporter
MGDMQDEPIPASAPLPPATRGSLVRRGLRLEYLTIGWNLIEGVVALLAAVAAGSVVLLGFGIDSFVETASGGVMVWRLRAERRRPERDLEALEGLARRLVAVSLFALAIYVAAEAGRTLWRREMPEASLVGIVLTATSLVVMWWLARAKQAAASALDSRAMTADAFQTTACFWLSLSALVGVGLNAALGWWWADPAAALVMTVFVVREAMEAWRDDPCCDRC